MLKSDALKNNVNAEVCLKEINTANSKLCVINDAPSRIRVEYLSNV
jgi:hypothetical protein